MRQKECFSQAGNWLGVAKLAGWGAKPPALRLQAVQVMRLENNVVDKRCAETEALIQSKAKGWADALVLFFVGRDAVLLGDPRVPVLELLSNQRCGAHLCFTYLCKGQNSRCTNYYVSCRDVTQILKRGATPLFRPLRAR